MTTIKVIYKEEPFSKIGIDSELDEKITAFFKKLGFEWTGQGFDLQTEERDIGFVSEEYRLCTLPQEPK